MRRPAKRSPTRLSSDSQRLIHIAQAVSGSTSRLEARTWERSLDLLLHKQLKSHHQGVIDHALEHLFKSDLAAYDVLVESVESNSEACALEYEEQLYSVQLLALPVLAWTRFSIASGQIPKEMCDGLATQLRAHVLADGACLSLAPNLYAIEQLPRHHADVFTLTQRMGQAALTATASNLSMEATPTAPFLADTRYLIAAVAVANGTPIYRWQMDESTSAVQEKTSAQETWSRQATPLLARFLPGCNVELLLPQPYYFACREADKRIRPAAIRAADHYLTHTLGVVSAELHANIGSFCEDINGQIDEYRIGFGVGSSDNIVYGIVWPLYEQEDGDEIRDPTSADDTPKPIEEVLQVLRECGIVHVKLLAERYTMEFCDDCGTPLFPAADGELVHPEMPEDTPTSIEHFH
ncbi:hypothetical protein FHW67_000172 [Herbaspirillum sp. Sphag1AN]|uniref:DUF2863 family protein n=1 Tax=unclassified Herbaspirillum TaxID=2624150 RepID=UPI0016157993|nr:MULTISPECIES: DUF2863 family protein [unclassified Herbaspirillum]MBB3210937.1 hypothetical protein [Herbaspirillum sp. Sphag1AN]MBB3244567.1 hypothetical protein [Herbaspirillum sp. Sphag64]